MIKSQSVKEKKQEKAKFLHGVLLSSAVKAQRWPFSLDNYSLRVQWKLTPNVPPIESHRAAALKWMWPEEMALYAKPAQLWSLLSRRRSWACHKTIHCVLVYYRLYMFTRLPSSHEIIHRVILFSDYTCDQFMALPILYYFLNHVLGLLEAAASGSRLHLSVNTTHTLWM